MVWDSKQYWLKAVRYAELASQPERDPWERPFWLSLALEFLARSALTKTHPVLNADPQDEGNLLYAFGFEIKGQPKSLPIHAVYSRLQKIIPELFTKPRREFCDFFSNVRNQELHTTDLPFEPLRETEWLARLYDVSETLCSHIGKKLKDLFGAEEAKTAQGLIKALKSEKVSNVKSKIAAHKKVFQEKPQGEQARVTQEQATLAKSWYGVQKKATCPACGSSARLIGAVERVSKPFYDDGHLLVKNVVLANRLECKACGLVLADIDELHAAEVQPHFEFNVATELHDYHEGDEEGEYNNM